METPKSTTATSTKGLPFPEMLPADSSSNKLLVERDEENEIRSVRTKMNYITPDTLEPYVQRDISGCDSGIQGLQWDTIEVQVQNARGLNKNIHKHGFELVSSPIINDNNNEGIDFLDTEQVIDDYYPHCEQLLKKILGDKVATVKAFDHNIRISSGTFGPTLKGGTGQAKAQVPLGIVHGDYTKESGPKRLDDLGKAPKANDVLQRRLGETPLLDAQMAQEALDGKRRFSLVNVWRSIDRDHPVQELPLACADASKVGQEELRILKLYYQDRIGQNYLVVHSPNHEWCYFPYMTHDEAMLIKQWDSAGAFATGKNQHDKNSADDEETSTFAIHSAFLDPTSDENSAPRKSIEVRCVIVWEIE